MILEAGKLIKVLKNHMAITTTVNIIGLEADELMLVVWVQNGWQGKAIRINTGELVHITSIDAITEMPAYAEVIL